MANSAYAKYDILLIPPSIASLDPYCTHAHPFVVIEVDARGVFALCISTKIDTFYNENYDFLIYEDENGFETTGLTDNSFVKNEEFFVDGKHELRILGRLSGELLQRFQEFAIRVDL